MINRQEIRKALQEYMEAKRQQEMITNDDEIQNLYEQRRIKEARELANKRYPLGRKTAEKGITLVQAMIKDIEEYKNEDPIDIYTKQKTFNQFLDLAKKV